MTRMAKPPFLDGPFFGGSVWESNPLAIRFTCRPTVLKTAATTRCANTSNCLFRYNFEGFLSQTGMPSLAN